MGALSLIALADSDSLGGGASKQRLVAG